MNTNQVTIVTGGGRGIGRAITLRLARETTVLVVGRTEADLRSICDEVKAAGGIAEFVLGDVADPDTADRAAAAALAGGRQIKNLVCNAGIGKGGASHEFDRDLFRQIMEVNVNGCFWFAQACLPNMAQNKSGAICMVSSILGVKGAPRDAAYTASKHAVVGLCRALALEYARDGIVVVPICPGYVQSDMTDRTIANLQKYRGMTQEEAVAKVARTNPQNRIVPAEEVAELIALVCSGLVPALNGNPLMVTGGE